MSATTDFPAYQTLKLDLRRHICLVQHHLHPLHRCLESKSITDNKILDNFDTLALLMMVEYYYYIILGVGFHERPIRERDVQQFLSALKIAKIHSRKNDSTTKLGTFPKWRN